MSTSQFGIAFEGEALEDGEIDVRDLAPALLALGDVIQAANRALNGDRAQASLKMRATKHGSFEALLSVDVSLLGAIGDMLDTVSANPDRLVATDQLLDLLIKGGTAVGLGTGGVVGFFKALKWLGGARPDSVEVRSDGTAAIIHNHTTIVVDRRTLDLLDDFPRAPRLKTSRIRPWVIHVSKLSGLTIGMISRSLPKLCAWYDRMCRRWPFRRQLLKTRRSRLRNARCSSRSSPRPSGTGTSGGSLTVARSHSQPTLKTQNFFRNLAAGKISLPPTTPFVV